MTTQAPLGLTFASLGALGARSVPHLAALAEDLGYTSFWTAEANATDAFTLLGAATVAAPLLDLGTGIVPMQIRSPSLTAMSAASLQALSPERNIYLGVGVSTPIVAGRWHGTQFGGSPLAQMREYLNLLRELLSGEPVTFEGDYWSVRKFRLGVRLGDRRPKLVVAALNPQMLRLAGELADAVLLNYVPASHVQTSTDEVREGGDAEIFAYVHAGVCDFSEAAPYARRDLFAYAMADGYARMFRHAGFADEVDELRERYASGDRSGAVEAVSDRMVQAIDFIGDPGQVHSFVQSYTDAGVDHPILMPLPWGQDRRSVAEATIRAAVDAS
ncbi:MAG: LLM class F420-dependent oxidoreductase [Actinomycetia bacterium]|nr:LLM class F420-dependent oxidoreductase [Actinomycetes bacterium]MCP4963314.1 LLM class F420-dependent oxidoreductase [Actinomycetes bacterium]